MSRIKRVHVHVTTYRGISPGATHYYGRLVCTGGDPYDHELRHLLSKKEAAEMNDGESSLSEFMQYEVGEESTRFSTRSGVIDAALAEWKDFHADAIILILGSVGIAEPQQVLAGPQKLMNAINQLVDQAEECNYWDDEDQMSKICDKWDELMEER